MAWSKYDPNAAPAQAPGDNTPRTWLLRWGWWITMAYTALGFGLILYWMLK